MKKILLTIILLLIPVYIFADECDIDKVSIKSIELLDKTDGVIEKSEPVINNKNVSLDLSMSNLNDKVEYKLIIDNKSNDDYELNKINIESNYINYKIESTNDSNIVKSNSEKEVLLTIEYKVEVPEESFVGNKFVDNKNIVISLSNDKEDIVNPKTGYNTMLLVFVALVSFAIFIILNEKEFSKLFIIFILLLIPLSVKSLCKIDIGVTSNIEIQKAEKNYLMLGSDTDSESNFLRTNLRKKDIGRIVFTNSLGNHKVEDDDCFDVSYNEDGSVLAWVSNDDLVGDDGETKYEITIGADGKVYEYDGAYQFKGLFYLSKIEGIEHFDTSHATSMESMFEGVYRLETIDLSHFNTSNVTDMSKMFYLEFIGSFTWNVLETLDLSSFNTSKVVDMSSMFEGHSNLKNLNISSFNTSNVINMSKMFSECSKLTVLDVSHFNTSKVTDMSGMFWGCSGLTELDVSNFNTSKVTDMSLMFCYCSSLTSLNLSNFDTSNVADMNNMFHGCGSLTSLDLSNFNTSNVVDMYRMFYYCSNLTNLKITNFDTSKVTNMSSMFAYCSSLSSLNLSVFNTSNVTDMSYMFSSCISLTSLDLSNFNTSKVTNMSYMFAYCSSLSSLNLSGFNTSNVTDMSYIFHFCSSLLSLNLSSFDTSKVTNMDLMFYSCSNLTSIYVSSSFVTNSVVRANRMFLYDTKLVGEKGTVYKSSQTGKSYAHIDGGTSNPGYFTDVGVN